MQITDQGVPIMQKIGVCYEKQSLSIKGFWKQILFDAQAYLLPNKTFINLDKSIVTYLSPYGKC